MIRGRKPLVFAIVVIVAAHSALLAVSAFQQSPTLDELAHLAAGTHHLRTGRFKLYNVNPPLVRMVAAVPVTFRDDVKWEWVVSSPASGARDEFLSARLLLGENGALIVEAVIHARLACIPFSVLGGLVCYLWAWRLYGDYAGLAALVLWCGCPNILGHGQLITPDVGAASLGLAAGYMFWRWLQEPNWKRTLIAGGLLGFAQLTKTTWTVLFALWPTLYTVYYWRNLQPWKQLMAMMLVSVWVLNSGYAFEGSFTRLREYRFLSESLGGPLLEGEDPRNGRNRFADNWIGNLPVPLPENYVLGIDYVKWEFERKMHSYLRGQWRLGGWYYYYLYACLIKVPLGTWLLGFLAVGMTIWQCRTARRNGQVGKDPFRSPLLEGEGIRNATWRDEVVLLVPALMVLVLVSSQTGFNHHVRYVLPAFPFLFIWISKVARVFESRNEDRARMIDEGRNQGRASRSRERKRKRWATWSLRSVVATALLWSIASSFSVYPHSLSYFNELVGGPKGGHWHLDYSNTDWGQDLLYLKDWYDDHPEARPLYLAYGLSLVDPAIVGIQYKQVPPGPVMNRPGTPKTENWPWGEFEQRDDSPLPTPTLPDDKAKWGPQPGWFVLSVNQIHRLEGDYEYFLEFEPVDWIGYSMMAFHITTEEANRVRRKLGLPELAK